MQKDRFIVDDIDEARNTVLRKKFNVFKILRADENNSYHFKKYLTAYLSLYHVFRDSKEFDNVVRLEGIELEFIGTDFGLKEIILTKIK